MKRRGTPGTEHRHQCPSCKLVFQHDPQEITGENCQHQHSAAHQCPSCGTSQYAVYQGDAQAVCRNNGIIPDWKPQPLPPEEEDDGLTLEQTASKMAEEFLCFCPFTQMLAKKLLDGQVKDGDCLGLLVAAKIKVLEAVREHKTA